MSRVKSRFLKVWEMCVGEVWQKCAGNFGVPAKKTENNSNCRNCWNSGNELFELFDLPTGNYLQRFKEML